MSMTSPHPEVKQTEGIQVAPDDGEQPTNEKVHRLRVLLTQARKYAEFLVGQIEEQKVTASVDDGSPTRTKRRRKVRAAAEDASTQISTFEQPRLLTGSCLRKYQLEGVQWLVSLYENGLNGILADEMGLGKTIECIGFLAFLRERGVLGPFLIVAPLSTLPNWACEIKRFAPSIPTLLYHGSPLERKTLRQERFPFPSASGGRGGAPMSLTPRDTAVIITSYELAMRDARYLAPIPWKYMIIDEGHRLKALNCRLIRELKNYNSANRLLLTGTPFHNNLTELWSLLNFLLPHIFSDLDDFLSWFDIDIELTREADRTEVLSHLHAILKPLLLRRLKSDVEEELPIKREYILFARLTPIQCQYYQLILEGRVRELVVGPESDDAKRADNGGRTKRRCRADYAEETLDHVFEDPLELDDDYEEGGEEADGEGRERYMGRGSRAERERSCLPETGGATASDSQGLQNKFMQLRKVCNHPYLFRYPVTQEDGDELFVSEDIVQASGKMRLLDQLLKGLLTDSAAHHKILIFSQMSRQLDILAAYLEWRSLSYCRIDGSVPISERQEQIDRFNGNSDCRLFLLSTRAGGLGINLTAADTVIFYDSDWNPQMDLQAQDRVHRIGQSRPVLVLRLASTPSIESQLLERAGEKRKLERLIIHKRKFKGRQQLLEQEEHDQLLAQELEEIINSNKDLFSPRDRDRRRIVVPAAARDELTAVELRAILDRTPGALSSPPFSSDSVRPVTY